ncbi:hypothetical protein ADL22_23210 [Streptomyces sp. NRRL F-4489]|uniref:hypothetical protein n=1 Tax=Streptomyces sp. NRRL F-4489 TaxID=1609095 RepID=UPI0007494A6A|nr:hypothetical protein [Streptomyces sp. NRRL F-4489]KUL36819.1 hypothetical protein ADL22_23210 [Streptomyces sp. NRRL F-4489]
MTDSVLHQTIQNLEGVLPELEEQERQLREQLDGVVRRVTAARTALEHLRVLTGAPLAAQQPVAAAALTTDAAAQSAPDAASAATHVAVSDEADGASTPSPDKGVTAERGAPAAAGGSGEAAGAESADGASSVVPQPRAATSPRTKRGPAKKPAGRKPAAAAKPKPKAKKAAAKRTEAAKEPAGKDNASLLDAALAILKDSGTPMRPRDINAALGREATPGQIESVRNTLDRAVKKTDLVTRPARGTYAAA